MPRLECSPETRILLLDGPLAGARTLVMEHVKEGERVAVPMPGFEGITTYVVTRVFATYCAECERLHRKAVALHVAGSVLA
jgi:aspartate/methionine/tyrosine aminotransferase